MELPTDDTASLASTDGPRKRVGITANRLESSAADIPAYVVEVLVPRAVHLGLYSYFVEPESLADAGVHASFAEREFEVVKHMEGRIVEVPFGARTEYGIVTGGGDKTLATRSVANIGPVVMSRGFMQYCEWVATRWCTTKGRVLLRAVPKDVLKEGARLMDRTLPLRWGAERVEHEKVPPRYVAVAPLLNTGDLIKNIIEDVGSGGQVMVLVPTIDEAAHIAEEVGASRLDKGGGSDRFDTWLRWRTGETKIGVGTRSQAMYEGYNVVAMIVIEDSHPGHVEAQQPYTNNRDLAVGRAVRLGGVHTVTFGLVPGPEALWGGTRFIEVGSKTRSWPNLRVLVRGDREQRWGIDGEAFNALSKSRAEDAMLVVPGGKVIWRCERCKEPWRCTRCGEEVPVGGCGCTEGVQGNACVQCGSTRRFLAGWDRARAEQALQQSGLPPFDIYEMRELVHATPHKLAVVLDSEKYRGWARDPGMESVRVVLRAARLVGHDGTVYACGVSAGGAVSAVGRSRSVREVAAWGWRKAKIDRAVPFRRDVTIDVGGSRRPPLTIPVGVVHGPSRMADGWRYIVLCSDAEMPTVRDAVESLRKQRYKVRVVVH